MTAPEPDLIGRTCVVTGASGGIGMHVAIGLARMGATVAIVCRNRARGETAVARISAEGRSESVSLFLADFAELGQVRRVAEQLRQRLPAIHVLVNNVGGAGAKASIGPDGVETTFLVNHLAPFLLTNLLQDRLTADAPARVVTVASRAHVRTTLDFDDLDSAKAYSTFRAYARSKLANVLFNRELAHRLTGTGVTATCCHPGVVATGIWDLGFPFSLIMPLAKLWMIAPEEGADTPLWLASAPEVEGASGGYYDRRKPVPVAPQGADDAAAKRLWDVSARMVGLG